MEDIEGLNGVHYVKNIIQGVRQTKIAVLGYGTVGSGVVEVLNVNRDSIARRAGEVIDIKYVLI